MTPVVKTKDIVVTKMENIDAITKAISPLSLTSKKRLLEIIEQQIKEIESEEKSVEQDWEKWDQEIEEDSNNGKLDFLLEEALSGKNENTLKNQLEIMANDPQIQTEINSINEEFMQTEMDGIIK